MAEPVDRVKALALSLQYGGDLFECPRTGARESS